jgi:DNA-binding IclR family transcriptional regulator
MTSIIRESAPAGAEPEPSEMTASAYLRGLQALEALAPEPLPAAEVARTLQVNRSTALRILVDLEAAGYVSRDPLTKRFSTVPARLWGLVANNEDYADWRRVIDPMLSGLRDEFGEATCLGVPARGFMVYMAFHQSPHPIALREHLGVTRPMHCSAIGKAYLSALDPQTLDLELGRLSYEGGSDRAARGPIELRERLHEVRANGYAVDSQETLEDVVCVAVPAYLAGTLLGAAGIQGPANRFTPELVARMAQRLIEEVGGLPGELSLRRK